LKDKITSADPITPWLNIILCTFRSIHKNIFLKQKFKLKISENIVDLDTSGSKMFPACLGCVALLFDKGTL